MSSESHPHSEPSGARRQNIMLPRVTIGVGLAATAVITLSILLRGPAAGVGPYLAEISESLNMGPTVPGILTALPGLCFGAVGALAVLCARKVGLSRALFWSAVALMLGGLTRVLTGSWVIFLLLSVVTLGGIAVANVLIPPWIKKYGGSATVILTTLYGALVTGSGALGSFLAAPLGDAISSLTDGQVEGWRGSLGVWAVLAVGPVVLWFIISQRTGHDYPRTAAHHEAEDGADTRRIAVWRSPRVWALTGMFGFQSMNAYIQFGWLPQIYRDAGLSIGQAGALSGLVSVIAVVGGLTMPTVVAKSKNLSWWMIFFGVTTAAGYLGLLAAPASAPILWALLLGFGGFSFTTAIALIPSRTEDPEVTAQLSGFVQPVGYMVAAAGPLLVGIVYSALGDWTVILIATAISGGLISLCGLFMAKPLVLDDHVRH